MVRSTRCRRWRFTLTLVVLLIGCFAAMSGPAMADSLPGDSDGDGVPDLIDLCPDEAGTQSDFGCPPGGVPDEDSDGIADIVDQCPGTATGTSVAPDGCDDPDGDLVSTHSGDNCPAISNPDQADTDGDGHGDACDDDNDNDGVVDADDECSGTTPGTTVAADGCDDSDGDGVSTQAGDNCPDTSNPGQEDTDADGAG